MAHRKELLSVSDGDEGTIVDSSEQGYPLDTYFTDAP
jgi:hypothetical protein